MRKRGSQLQGGMDPRAIRTLGLVWVMGAMIEKYSLTKIQIARKRYDAVKVMMLCANDSDF